MSSFILFMVLIGPGSNQITSTSADFTSQATCQAALENIRTKITRVGIILLTCERK